MTLEDLFAVMATDPGLYPPGHTLARTVTSAEWAPLVREAFGHPEKYVVLEPGQPLHSEIRILDPVRRRAVKLTIDD